MTLLLLLLIILRSHSIISLIAQAIQQRRPNSRNSILSRKRNSINANELIAQPRLHHITSELQQLRSKRELLLRNLIACPITLDFDGAAQRD